MFGNNMIVENNIIFVLLVIYVNLSTSQVLQFGTCGNVDTMKYLDLEKFSGKWYEIERFPTWYEDYSQCAFKTIQVCGRNIQLEHGFVKDGIQYILHMNSTFTVDEAVFEIKENNIDHIGIPLSVIATDYSNYAIVYGCKNSYTIGIKYTSAWILSREKTLDPEIRTRAHEQLNAIPFASLAYLEEVSHDENECEFLWTAHVHAVDKYEEGEEEIEAKADLLFDSSS